MLRVEIHSSDRIATKLSLNDSQYPIWQLLFPSESLVFNWSLIGQPSHQDGALSGPWPLINCLRNKNRSDIVICRENPRDKTEKKS